MASRKPGLHAFPAFLALVFLLFTGIMIYTWYGASEADPVILDEKGRPRNAAPAQRP